MSSENITIIICLTNVIRLDTKYIDDNGVQVIDKLTPKEELFCTLVAPGGSPEIGQSKAFLAQYEVPGTFQISLTACFDSACSEAAGSVTVTENWSTNL